jgi:hypothetical protein
MAVSKAAASVFPSWLPAFSRRSRISRRPPARWNSALLGVRPVVRQLEQRQLLVDLAQQRQALVLRQVVNPSQRIGSH